MTGGLFLSASRTGEDLPEEFQVTQAGLAHWRITLRNPGWQPPMDLYENDTAFFVRVEVAGMQEEDFILELNDRALSIRGARADVPERRAFHQMEIRFGEFNLEVELPGAVIPEAVKATYQNGFLQVVLPKQPPRQIQIQA
jgi:HSP20 family protein